MYLSTSTEDFPEMYLSTFQVLYKLYLSTDVLKYKVLLPGSAAYARTRARLVSQVSEGGSSQYSTTWALFGTRSRCGCYVDM